MDFLGDLGAGVLLLFIVLEFVVNFVALRAASTSLPNFVFTDKKAIMKAAGMYSVLHILGGFFLSKVLGLPIFSGTGLLVGYFVDVALLWLTDLAIKELEIKEKEALFTGAFLMIFCWAVAWFLLLLVLGMAGAVDLRPISTI
jgi:hypothetical protein